MESILLTQVTPVQFEQLISEAVGKKLEEFKKIFTHTSSNDKLLTRKESAKFFGVSISTIDNWRREGKIIPYYIGSKVRFKRGELEQAMVKLKNDGYGRD
ncbi:helix-turn-helix domain-containing protein [Moheibacter stercoris]|uniref:Excisionase family DNA binding protein n=1 Tax=Moheibacter stercoris TaxID=1628251 RepID=A0ABV2LXP2_9FLAO